MAKLPTNILPEAPSISHLRHTIMLPESGKGHCWQGGGALSGRVREECGRGCWWAGLGGVVVGETGGEGVLAREGEGRRGRAGKRRDSVT